MRGIEREMLFYLILFVIALVLAVVFIGRYLTGFDPFKLLGSDMVDDVSIFKILVAVVAAVLFLLVLLNIMGSAKATYLSGDAKFKACNLLRQNVQGNVINCCLPPLGENTCSEDDLKKIKVEGFDANKNGKPGDSDDNLWVLCQNYFNLKDVNAKNCAKECGCK